MLVKICGLMRREDAGAAIRAGADMLGFVFVPGSRRWLDPAGAGWIRDIEGVETVGVFRDAPVDFVLETACSLGLDRVQLHGEESDGMLDLIDRPVIRRVGAGGRIPDTRRVALLLEKGVLPLVDPGAGQGLSTDWSAVGAALGGLRFALAGGLRPDNVALAIRQACPVMVDVSSGVESGFGRKSPGALRDFVRQARGAFSRQEG